MAVRAYTGIFAERIENGLGAGTPDVFYTWRGRYGWIENKFREATPQRAYTTVFGARGLRKEQIAWWLSYLHAGGSGQLAVGVGRLTWVWAANEALVRGFNDMTWEQFCTRAPVDAANPLRLQMRGL